jgi:phosphoserine phosphatase
LVRKIPRLIALDMDGTLLDGRVIYNIGQRFGFESEIEKISKSSRVPYIRSQRIAKLLRGLAVSEFTGVVRAIPLMKGAVQAVKQLKDKNYKVGIISDSYTLATEIVTRRLEMDFHVANILEVKNGVFTGLLEMPLGWEKIECPCKQSVCKRYHLFRLAKRYSVNLSSTAAVGDSKADLCMIESAGIGILFNPAEDNVPQNVKHIVRGNDLRLVLSCLTTVRAGVTKLSDPGNNK